MMMTNILLLTAGIATIVIVAIVVGRIWLKKGREVRDTYIEGLRYLVDGEVELAYAALVQTVQADTSNIDAYILLGEILRQQGDSERALKLHRDVLVRSDLTPDFHRIVLKSLALDYMALQQWSAAERTLIDLDTISKGEIWARLCLMQVYEVQGKWESAFNLGKEMQGESEVTSRRLARCKVESAKEHSSREDYHKARLLLKEALKFDSQYSEPYILIGDTYSEEGRIQDAIEWWGSLVEEVPVDAGRVFTRLEEALYELGEFSKMAEIYRKHLETNPENPNAALALAHLLERKGDIREAIDILQRYKPHSSDPNRMDRTLALLHYRAGESEAALDLALGIFELEGKDQVEVNGT